MSIGSISGSLSFAHVAPRDPVGDAEHDHDSDDGGTRTAAAPPSPPPSSGSGPIQLGSSVMAALVQLQQG